MSHPLPRFLLLLLFALSLSCGEATSPSDVVVGSYQLESVNGHPVPYVFPSTETDYTESWLSGSLELRLNQEMRMVWTRRAVPTHPGVPDDAPPDVFVQESPSFFYKLRNGGRTLEIWAVTPLNPQTDPAYTGQRTSRGYTVEWPGNILHFVR